MKKKAMWKDIRREIKNSRGRFFSIFALITLGVFAFTGLKVTGPNMRNTANDYFKKYNLSDITVQSTLGLEEQDVKVIESIPNTKEVEFGYMMDVFLEETGLLTRIFSLTDYISKYEVLEGKLPEESGEIAIDEKLSREGYSIGDTITFEKEEKSTKKDPFKKRTFHITAIVSSPEYVFENTRGSSPLGNGQLDAFAVIPEEDFNMEVYTIARLVYKDTVNIKENLDKYQLTIDKHVNELEKALKHRPKERLSIIQKEAKEEIEKSEEKVKEAKNELKRKQKEMDNAKVALQYAPISKEEKAKKLEELNNIESNAKKDIAKAEEEIQNAKKEVSSLREPKYIVSDRNIYPGYSQYLDNSKRIEVLSNVFPVFFFMIAALVCLTTMTRMVEEQRTQMGVLKALGYSNVDIMKKFVVYGFLGSFAGTLVGIITGHEILPRIIFNAYAAPFIFNAINIDYFISYSILSFIIGLLCTTLSAIFSARFELGESAAILMRPKAPKEGTRILLERITFIWSKMSFNHKVTARNLFRYKKRMFMTIMGVAGCTALLFTGFGIKDSLEGIVKTQYEDMIQYDGVVVYDVDAEAHLIQSYKEVLSKEENISKSIGALYKKVTVKEKNIKRQEVTLIVPENTKNFLDFMILRQRRTQAPIEIENTGAVITEKLAVLLNVKIGDFINIQDENENFYEVKIASITEMYLGHFIYLSPQYYESVFKQKTEFNSDLIFLDNSEKEKLDDLSEILLGMDGVLTVVQSKDTSKAVIDMLDGLNLVIIVLILTASLLAIVVLYNLTNINVSERLRELSTIKVLGFYPKEVTMYVYRETLILTLIGILLGYIFGFLLHHFIMGSLPPDNAMFNPMLKWTNFLISALLTLLFSSFVMIIMHMKLKVVDMIEALKAVE